MKKFTPKFLLSIAAMGIMVFTAQELMAFSYSDNLAQKQASYLLEQKENVIGKRGCCSHHKGVCGCSGGRVVCCDGTLSPSCRC